MSADEDLKLENHLCFSLYAASREVIKHFRPFLDSLNITYTQYLVMLVLWESGICSVKTLGQRLYLDSGTLTPVLKHMEQKGLLRRFRSPEDERVVMTEITDSGKAMRAQAMGIPAKMQACMALSDEEKMTLGKLLNKLLPTINE